MNHQTADPKAKAFVFLFFPTAHFLKTILASRTSGTFTFATKHKADPLAKPKEPFFANTRHRIIQYSNNITSKIFNLNRAIPLPTFVVLIFSCIATNTQSTNFYGTIKVQSDG